MTDPSKPDTTQLPEWAVHISEVYKWAEQSRDHGGRMTKRTIQWYSSEGLLPSPQRIGKEAYYNRHIIYRQIRIIEILNRRFGMLLSEVRRIIRKATQLPEYVATGGIVVDVDDEGEPVLGDPIELLCELLEGFLEYERNEESKCDCDNFSGPQFSEEQRNRLQTMEHFLLTGLRGDAKEFQNLVTRSVIGLEEDLFPAKKEAAPAQLEPSDLEKVPF